MLFDTCSHEALKLHRDFHLLISSVLGNRLISPLQMDTLLPLGLLKDSLLRALGWSSVEANRIKKWNLSVDHIELYFPN